MIAGYLFISKSETNRETERLVDKLGYIHVVWEVSGISDFSSRKKEKAETVILKPTGPSEARIGKWIQHF